MKKATQIVCVAAIVTALCSTAMAVDIVTIPVGNPGNAVDGNGGYGDVAYSYNIGKYEVTAGQYTEFLNAVAATDTYGLYNTFMWLEAKGCKIQRTGSSGSYSYSVASDWANRPVNYVGWGDAARFVNWLHNDQPTGVQDNTTTEDGAYYLNGANSNAILLVISREPDWKWAIPSEDEWYKAAYHKNDGMTTTDYNGYPTGGHAVPGYINIISNFSRTGDGSFIEGGTDPGNYATYHGSPGGIHGIGSPYYRTEVGEHENSESPYGTFDQAGNVSEWTEDIKDARSRVVRGGSFYDMDYILHRSDRHVGGAGGPGSEDRGFRVSLHPATQITAPETDLQDGPPLEMATVNPNGYGEVGGLYGIWLSGDGVGGNPNYRWSISGGPEALPDTLLVDLPDTDLDGSIDDYFLTLDHLADVGANDRALTAPYTIRLEALDNNDLPIADSESEILLLLSEPITPGDTNDDHIVDKSDLANFVAQFGGPPDTENADFNGDIFVDLEDFAILRGNFGFGAVSSPDAEFGAAIPEPSTLILLALGGLRVVIVRKPKPRNGDTVPRQKRLYSPGSYA